MKITRIEAGRQNRRRVNIYVDDAFAFSCFADVLSQFDLRKGQDMDEDRMKAVRRADELQSAREYAFSYAARGPKTEKQFRDKLHERGYGPESTDAAVELLRTYGYVDDEAYARRYAAELFASNGPWAVRRKLAQRGIDRRIIDAVTADVETGDVLEQQLDRLIAKNAHVAPEKAKQRIVRSLAAKGFAFDEIHRALNHRLRETEEI